MTRLVLHIGLLKTATTTIQDWAASKRSTLAQAGVFYPKSFTNENVTKHQELVEVLKHGHIPAVRQLFEHISNEKEPHIHTVWLSTEGLTNHLTEGEEKPQYLAHLRDLFTAFDDTVLFMMTRQSEPWIRSYYQQFVANPPNPAFGFATPLRLEEFAQTPRIQALMDHETLQQRALQAYGADRFVSSTLEGSWAEDLCGLLAVPEMAQDLRAAPSSNKGLSIAATEAIRQINEQNLPGGQDRQFLVEWLRNGTYHTRLPADLEKYVTALNPEDEDQKELKHLMLQAFDHRNENT